MWTNGETDAGIETAQSAWLNNDEIFFCVPKNGLDEELLSAVKESASRPHRRREFSNHADEPGLVLTLQQQFESQAQVNPGALAITYGEIDLTYGELDAQADGLAMVIQKGKFVFGDIIAICIPPSIAFVRAILATLKAGAAYLLLDPDSGPEKISSALRSTGIQTLLQSSARPVTEDLHRIRVISCAEDGNDLPFGWPNEYPTNLLSPAFARWTGKDFFDAAPPFLPHAAVLERISRLQNICPIGAPHSLLLHYEDFVETLAWSLLWPLSFGAKVVIPTSLSKVASESLLELIARERLSVIHISSASLISLIKSLDPWSLRSLKAFFCSIKNVCHDEAPFSASHGMTMRHSEY